MGILPGGGMALFQLATRMCDDCSEICEENIANKILKEAFVAPAVQIIKNAGKEFDEVYKDIPGDFYVGYDLKNDKYGNLLELGVIDPMKVTKSALQNAVSVAVTILSTNAIITMARTYESQG